MGVNHYPMLQHADLKGCVNDAHAIAEGLQKYGFKVVVLESGTGLPSRCNNNELVPGVPRFAANNPFTPDVLAHKVRATLDGVVAG